MADTAPDHDRLQALIAAAVVDPLVHAQLFGATAGSDLMGLGLTPTEVELIESLEARDLAALAEGQRS